MVLSDTWDYPASFSNKAIVFRYLHLPTASQDFYSTVCEYIAPSTIIGTSYTCELNELG